MYRQYCFLSPANSLPLYCLHNYCCYFVPPFVLEEQGTTQVLDLDRVASRKRPRFVIWHLEPCALFFLVAHLEGAYTHTYTALLVALAFACLVCTCAVHAAAAAASLFALPAIATVPVLPYLYETLFCPGVRSWGAQRGTAPASSTTPNEPSRSPPIDPPAPPSTQRSGAPWVREPQCVSIPALSHQNCRASIQRRHEPVVLFCLEGSRCNRRAVPWG